MYRVRDEDIRKSLRDVYIEDIRKDHCRKKESFAKNGISMT